MDEESAIIEALSAIPSDWDAMYPNIAPDFSSGNFDLGSIEALKSHPIGWNRQDQGDYTGVSYYDTYGGGTDVRPTSETWYNLPGYIATEALPRVLGLSEEGFRQPQDIQSSAILDALAARQEYDPRTDPTGHLKGGPFIGSLQDLGLVTEGEAQDFANTYGNLRAADYNVGYEGGIPSQATISENLTEVPIRRERTGIRGLEIPLGHIETTIKPTEVPPFEPQRRMGPGTNIPGNRYTPDYNLMDSISAALQNLGYGSGASPEDQAKSAQILYSEAMDNPVFHQNVTSFGPSSVFDAISNRDISMLPTYEPIIPAFAGGSISIPEELPSDIPFPESVENLTAAVTADPIVSAPPQEEVSEERVKVIKKKPKEKRTSVEEQVVVASEVKKALDNASKGKKVKNELKAIVELAKVDPTIVKRYTTPGSQALQDITAQVDSFSFMPTIQKKKKTVDPWAFEDRRGGRR